MLKLKTGISLRALSPQMVLATLGFIEPTFRKYGYDAVITSGNDSTHKSGSLHYAGKALDFRLNNLKPEDRIKVVGEIAVILGDDFDVLHESEGNPNEHMHVEYDPRS